MTNDFLVSPEWLKEHLDSDGVKVIEAPWKPDGYNRAHIKGAICLPRHSYLKAANDDGERSVHVFNVNAFKALVNSLGIKSSDEVVVYDEFYGLFAARFWWVFRYFGFNRVKVLDGGWQSWIERSFPISVEIPDTPEGSDIEADIQSQNLITVDELKDALNSDNLQIWDTRRDEEYDGTGETSNKRKGHIPKAINIEWKAMLQDAQYNGGARTFKSAEDMEQILEAAGFRKDKRIITHCQAGIRGAFGSFVLEMLGYPQHQLYDASMAEWANQDDTPMELSTNL